MGGCDGGLYFSEKERGQACNDYMARIMGGKITMIKM